MAIDYYKNLTTEERLDKVGEIIAKGVYLYHQKNNDEIKKASEEKETVSIPKIKQKGDVNLVPSINLDEKILTIKEAIDFLRISRTTFWRLRKQSKLPYCALSNKLIRFKLSEILKYLEIKQRVLFYIDKW